METIKTLKLKEDIFLDPIQNQFDYKGETYKKWKANFTNVKYDNGQYNFTKGQTIEFVVKDQIKKTAMKPKLIVNTQSTNSNTETLQTNLSILLQVCYKENMTAFAKDNRASVMQNTKEDYEQLRNILNNS
jgi:hypothetical protein